MKFTEAKPTGPNNEIGSYPRYAEANSFADRKEEAQIQTELINSFMSGGKRRKQRGGQRPDYGKPGIGSEDSLCGSYQTPDETQFTPDKYIVVPQPPGGSGGALDANDTVINLAKTFTQAKANSEGDWSTADSKFEDDKQNLGNLKIKGGSRRKSLKKRHRRGRRKTRRKRRGGGLPILMEEIRAERKTPRRKKRTRKRRGERRRKKRKKGGAWCKCSELEKQRIARQGEAAWSRTVSPRDSYVQYQPGTNFTEWLKREEARRARLGESEEADAYNLVRPVGVKRERGQRNLIKKGGRRRKTRKKRGRGRKTRKKRGGAQHGTKEDIVDKIIQSIKSVKKKVTRDYVQKNMKIFLDDAPLAYFSNPTEMSETDKLDAEEQRINDEKEFIVDIRDNFGLDDNSFKWIFQTPQKIKYINAGLEVINLYFQNVPPGFENSFGGSNQLNTETHFINSLQNLPIKEANMLEFGGAGAGTVHVVPYRTQPSPVPDSRIPSPPPPHTKAEGGVWNTN
jgi:hypothetical protein